MAEVVVVSYARTPIGAFQGALSTVSAPHLGAAAIKAALERAKLQPEHVNEVILGNVLSAGIGQAPARQAALYAGLPHSTPCMTINKVCGSGMKALMLGMQSILLGDSKVVVAGGMENMSLVPYLAPGAREGYRLGHKQLIDAMVFDGLWDPYNDQHMGNCAELCAAEKGFSRQEQDAYAIESFRRAQAAQAAGHFKDEIVPVEVPGRKGAITVSTDEGPAKVDFDKIPGLRPAFQKDGTVTAANASSINDGAAVLVLMDRETAERNGLTPLARLVCHASYAHTPEWFTTAPIPAVQAALKKAQWDIGSVDAFEINEAFAVVALAAQKELGIPSKKLNALGGAVALGHPIGASGARIVCTLLSSLKANGGKRGVAGICIGGGEATALCLERL
ncbi:MAG: acetyl-CoA C-acyltransferase [Chlamydiia bacterium]|nr:acetyl-CoA C-acyltransferase [Chlamydiia bacterium]